MPPAYTQAYADDAFHTPIHSALRACAPRYGAMFATPLRFFAAADATIFAELLLSPPCLRAAGCHY